MQIGSGTTQASMSAGAKGTHSECQTARNGPTGGESAAQMVIRRAGQCDRGSVYDAFLERNGWN